MMEWLRKNWFFVTVFVLAVFFIGSITFLVTIPTKKDVSSSNWEKYWKIQNEDAWHWKGPEKYLIYVKDKRTNLCFAISSPYGQGGFMASVPCEKVKEYLEKIDEQPIQRSF